MSNIEKYKEIFRNIFEVEETELGEGFTFDDIAKWDSLTHLSLITELEDTFEVMFETDDILNYGSFTNGISILKKYGVDFGE